MSAGKDAVIHRLEFTAIEKPIIAQIWGLKPEKYREASELVADMGFDGIDINMGCPVAKIVKNGACSALIDNPSLAQEIILATKEGSKGLPVSVKTRLGVRQNKTESWFSFLLGLNLAAITVHGRLAKDMSEKPARWDEVTKVVQLRNQINPATIIIGNGDIQNLSDLRDKMNMTGADGGMVGRAALFNPLFFNPEEVHIKDMLREHKIGLLIKHLELAGSRWGMNSSLGVMKKFSGVYLVAFDGASTLRQKILDMRSIGDALACLKESIQEHLITSNASTN